MEDKRRESKWRRENAFASLLIEGSNCTPLNGFQCAQLDEHPFGLLGPKLEGRCNVRLTELDFLQVGATDISVRSLTRMVARAITNWGLGFHNHVNFLRVVQAPVENDGSARYDMYYEVCIGRNWFMTGACTNCSGTGSGGMNDLEALFRLLSSIYGVQVNRCTVTYEQSQKVHYGLGDVLYKVQQERKQHEIQRRKEEEECYKFHVGQMIKLTDEGVRSVASSWSEDHRKAAKETFEALAVENVPSRCSCGLGDDPAIPLSVHMDGSAGRCNIMRRHHAMHTQIVTIKLTGKDWEDERHVSGYYLTSA